MRGQLPDATLPQLVLRHARLHPAATALRQKERDGWVDMSWAALAERALNCAAGLLAHGLAAPGHVAMFGENRSEWLIAQIATGLTKGIALGCYPTSSPDELRHALVHADVEVVFCQDRAFLAKLEPVRHELKQLRLTVLMVSDDLPVDLPGVTTMKALEAEGAEALRVSPKFLDPFISRQSTDDIGLMVYTSGSTGPPKAAMLSYRNMRASAEGFGRRLNYGPQSRVLCYLPMCHIAEQAMSLFAPIFYRTTVAFGGGLPCLLEDLQSVRPTYFSGVPRVWMRLQAEILRHFEAAGRAGDLRAALDAGSATAFKPRRNWSVAEQAQAARYAPVSAEARAAVGLDQAVAATSGAASLPIETLKFFRALGFPLLELYGQTEACSIMTLQRRDRVVPGAVGPPISTVNLKLAQDGEILVRGDNVFCGYYKNPEATKSAIKDGWLHTGDIGKIEGGQLRIIDRKKDIMITDGGKNIAPAEIEALMRTSDLIEECVLVADGRKYVSALIQISPSAVSPSDYRSSAADPTMETRLGAEIRRLNAKLARVAQIKRAYILPEPLRRELGDVTPTLKLRRFAVHGRYKDQIEALYAGKLGFEVAAPEAPPQAPPAQGRATAQADPSDRGATQC